MISRFGAAVIIVCLIIVALTWTSSWAIVFALLAAFVAINEWIIGSPDKEVKK